MTPVTGVWNNMKWWCLAAMLLLFGCEKAPQQTESMLRWEQNQSKIQAEVDRAQAVLKPEVLAEPLANLQQLAYAREILQSAHAIKKQAKLIGVPHSGLEQADAQLQELHPLLAKHALTLMQILVERTLTLRQRIDEIKSTPFEPTSTGSIDSMVDYLGKEYNRDIDNCCLKDLYRISDVIRGSEVASVREVHGRIGRITVDLTEILRDDEKAPPYLAANAKIQSALNPQP